MYVPVHRLVCITTLVCTYVLQISTYIVCIFNALAYVNTYSACTFEGLCVSCIQYTYVYHSKQVCFLSAVELFDADYNLLQSAQVSFTTNGTCFCYGICGCVVSWPAPLVDHSPL